MNNHIIDVLTGMFYVAAWTYVICPALKEFSVDLKRIVCGLWNGEEIDLDGQI
jgi:hypothetical protein